MRVGATDEIVTEVRLIALTNRNPERAMQGGMLRLDLYQRLNVFPVHLPALGQRSNDIELLAQ